MDPSGEERIIGKVDARYHVRGAEGHLLGFGEEVVRVAVEDLAPDRGDRNQLLRDELGSIQEIETEPLPLRRREDLEAELPLGVVAALDGFPQVAPMEVGVGAGDLDRLVPDE